jgi:branched-subunit amino acid ABC-type transport system permease component
MLNALVSGILTGGLYALVGLSLVLTFLATRTGNFSTGELASFGAAVVVVGGVVDLPALVRFFIAVVVAGLAGVLIERLVIAPFHSGDHDYRWFLTTLALGMVLVDLQTNALGSEPISLNTFGVDGFIRVAGVGMSKQLLLVLLVAVVAIASISLALKFTHAGKIVRATSEDPSTALLMGISVRTVGMVTYALASVIAVVAGLLWSATAGVSPALGPPLLIGAISVAVIGGINSVPGLAVGGLIYGITTQVGLYWFGPAVGSTAGLLAVVAILVLRPQGVLGRPVPTKV